MISDSSLRRNVNSDQIASPKSSPRAARSPVIQQQQQNSSRQDTTGTLKTTISLGKTPSILNSGPFYLMKEPLVESELTGSANLIQHYNLEHSYNKFCCGKRMKDQLSSFLPNLPGNIDTPANGDNSSLRSLIEKPPIVGKELIPLSQSQLSGFRLHPGPLPEQYRLMAQPSLKKKHKQKKSKHRSNDLTSSFENQLDSNLNTDSNSTLIHEKKHKKQRKHDDEKERKKKKKDKKKKKQKHIPDISNNASLTNPLLLPSNNSI